MPVGKSVVNYHEIEIAVSPKQVFDYVTRADRWHEWHPASTSAELPRIPLRAGDRFREIITVSYPLIRIRRHTEYTVTVSQPGKIWEASGKSSLFDLTIHYEFKPAGKGTLFQRTLTYRVKGLLAWFEPIIVRPKIRRQSAQALGNLRAKLIQDKL
jgi:hypothetical protein